MKATSLTYLNSISSLKSDNIILTDSLFKIKQFKIEILKQFIITF